MNETTLLIVTALFSGIVATGVTLFWQDRSAKLAEKRRIFTVLMSKRYEIIAEESVEAMNTIDVIFYKSSKVRNAWKEFYDATKLPEQAERNQLIQDKHLRLLEVMAADLGYSKVNWEDIKHYYCPIGLSERKNQEEVLRKVQIEAGIAQLKGTKDNNDMVQADEQAAMNTQILLKALENPDGMVKLLEAAGKYNR